ncbi:serine hydrolase domain-containing protein [Sphingosinicella soli]|uniref:CubicO group peptidase (Beta-lactamase class C family) n=1 Tax=Sphingosinicella soli TaxID=333708 RepID=A0A7W7B3Z9_9SPHN|nr:serine hydrolase domain-containing protein [Sphingosinicella soli]MBB4633594.1 CubicO group peptidase (beta-lactamase class C family) [Sphingosinicella soli]
MVNRKIARWLGLAPVVLLLAQAAPLPAAAESAARITASTATTAAVDKVMADGIASGKLAGGAIGVMKDGKIVFVKGYGLSDLEDGQPVKADTIFRIGSITKQFTAAMLMMLVERGELSLADPISKYFPDFPKADGITVRHLLDHTSGIRSYTGKNFASRGWREHDTKEMVSYIAGQDELIDFPVGEDYRYNNSAYVLASAIVEKVTGKPYGTALEDMISKPLGLKDTAYDDERAIVPRRAKGYGLRDDKLANPLPLSVSVAHGAGAMRSTAADMLRWQDALFAGKVVKPESLALMIAPAKLKDGRLTSAVRKPDSSGRGPMEYGLGLAVGERDGRRMIGHGGAINGFNSALFTYPDEKTAIVLLVNTEGGANKRYDDVAEAWFNSNGGAKK